MRYSRLRLQLAASFALVFLVGLGATDAALFTTLRRAANDELTARVTSASSAVMQSVREEMLSTRRALGHSAHEVLGEWPPDSNAYVVYDSRGAIVASRNTELWPA